jgi:hypothetical protein
LIDAANLDPDQRRHLVSAPEPFYSGPIVAVPPQMATPPAETVLGVGTAPTSAYLIPVLLGLGSVALMVLAALQWPRTESPSAPSDAAPEQGSSSVSAGRGTAGVTSMPALTEADVPLAKPASASSDVPQHEAAVTSLPQPSGPAKEPDKSQARRSPVEEILAVQPPAAGTAKKPAPAVEGLRAPPKQPRPRPAAPECTPQVDALGLCEPGAHVTGR